MMLVEDGTLDLAAPVDRWLPELADRQVLARIDGPLDDTVPAQRPVTVEDLLTFRLGFGILTEPTFNPPFPIVTAAEEMRLSLGAPDPRTPHPPDELDDDCSARCRRCTSPANAGCTTWDGWCWACWSPGLPTRRSARCCAAVMFDPLGMVDTGFWTTPAKAASDPAVLHDRSRHRGAEGATVVVSPRNGPRRRCSRPAPAVCCPLSMTISPSPACCSSEGRVRR